jgi:hypothetical protein
VSKRHSDRNYGKPLYYEATRWSLPLWLFVIFIDLSILLAIWAALSISATWITASILTILTLTLYFKSAQKITVTQGWLIVGPAAIERAFIYNFKALKADEMRRARGAGGSPYDYLQIRFWIPNGVKFELRDPRDKTSAWLISSRNYLKLVEVLSNPEH